MLFQGGKKQGLVNIIRVFIYLFKTFSYPGLHFTSACSSGKRRTGYPEKLEEV